MARTQYAANLATLVRWIGPWGGRAEPPADRRVVGARPREGARGHYVYRGRGRPAGVYVVSPGLHPQGPDDPRLDRFCRALAASGAIVVAPFLPSFCALRIRDGVADELAPAFDFAEDVARREGLPRPAIFSVSFGSMPAIELAARPAYRDRVGALVLFGGFADFAATVRFAATGVARSPSGDVTLARDPLNTPALFLNLLAQIDARGDPDAIAGAWRRMIDRTWGRPEMKAAGARDAIASEIAATLHAAQRELFLVGCGLAPGAEEVVERGLAGDRFAFFDPRPHLANVRARVSILHGRGDDVIPWFEADAIARALPPGHPHDVLVTGMASHTGAVMPRPRELAREAVTMLATARAILDGPRGR